MNSEADAGTSGSDGGYVHRPDDWDGESGVADDPGADGSDEGLGRTGTVLVAVVVLAFLVIPGIIYVRPAAPGELGLGFLTAMLVLPMLPAALLGATAVWSAVADRRD
ncbi:hypothetical protein HUG10_09115 [Halorarum halophilum]|uniref:Uncharacterized protein n=1 Tax=Halorarum halophilum TaxID=2743090 RepID=A0A7D5KMG4_9EURY|nr:hypothetical protein [Halobaculum halophilum]QLG27702.1 hypothetical protein HUG10_09115 [Halobaculum halophilum]